MVKFPCPWCGEQIETGDFTAHLETCPKYPKKTVFVERPRIAYPTWQERVAEAIAREVIAKGRFEKYELDELTKKIEKMLAEYEREWG